MPVLELLKMYSVFLTAVQYQYQNAQEKENIVYMKTHAMIFLHSTSIVHIHKQEILGYAHDEYSV